VSDAKFRGQIDRLFQDTAVVGWATTADGEPCTVTVLVNDREIGTVRSTGARPDVQKAGMSKGLGGWDLRIWEELEPGLNRVTARFPDGSMLAGTLKGVRGPDAPKEYRGAVECSEAPVLSGWSLADKEPASVTLDMDDRAPMQIPALEPRPDLSSKGISNGEGGWSVDVSSMLAPGTNHIRLRFPDGKELPGSPITIVSDSNSVSTVAAASRFRGAIDNSQPPILSGWAVGEQAGPTTIAVTINDGEAIALVADEARPDLGTADGTGGWSLRVDERLSPGENVIHLRFPDGQDLPGSPITIGATEAAAIRYIGAIDVGQPPMLTGWSVSSSRDGAPVTVTINDDAPITIAAEGPRGDLAQNLSKGRGGWGIVVTDLLKPGANTIHLRFPDGSDLPGSPLSIRTPGGEPEPAAAAAPPVVAEPAPEPAPEPNKPLSLAELDEFSIDDLVDVVASGIFDFGQPDPAEQDETKEEAAAPEPEPVAPPRKYGVFSRLLGRHRRGD